MTPVADAGILTDRPSRAARIAVEMRVRGRVQGVGFRPTVWRLARALGLDGEVRNDAEGVLIRAAGPRAKLAALRAQIERAPPPLAEIRAIEMGRYHGPIHRGFEIVASVDGEARTEVAPDAKVCAACAAEIRDPANRRHGYALTNCTHCGPRLSIVRAIPYDRARTTMAPFALCADCEAEYRDPADRRFHAEPTCCPVCGPRVSCLALGDAPPAAGEPIAFAAARLAAGDIVAVKGLGGYQLACDATNAAAVARLRVGKRREGKPFALMARDLAAVRAYCEVCAAAADALASPQAPIVLMPARAPGRLPDAVAPGLMTLGFMLPTSPLHLLLLDAVGQPLVMTSGNLTDEPQITDDGQAALRLAPVAAYVLRHDRAIAARVDDSVVRAMDGAPRLVRRARGYAPAPIALPRGFEAAPDILALGGELKATFCLVKDGQAILSQHQGDLEHPAAYDDYRRNLALYAEIFDHAPTAVAADLHPDYLSTKLARERPEPLIQVQHHHAHVAACLAENGWPLDGPPVVGVALDGLGFGEDGALWGGEFLLADYRGCRRIAALTPVAMPGGAQAVREPWRNLYAHLVRAMGWAACRTAFPANPGCDSLTDKPLAMLDAMLARGLNSPPASSCGRLFDAVAAALGLCGGRQAYEGDAAARLEALAGRADGRAPPYPFAFTEPGADGVRRLEPAPMWRALFEDLARGVPAAEVAMSFHQGLAAAVAGAAEAQGVATVALSGGCFQNRLLFEGVSRRLREAGLAVLAHRLVPANDGGLSLGQAAVAAARLIDAGTGCAPEMEVGSCA